MNGSWEYRLSGGSHRMCRLGSFDEDGVDWVHGGNGSHLGHLRGVAHWKVESMRTPGPRISNTARLQRSTVDGGLLIRPDSRIKIR